MVQGVNNFEEKK